MGEADLNNVGKFFMDYICLFDESFWSQQSSSSSSYSTDENSQHSAKTSTILKNNDNTKKDGTNDTKQFQTLTQRPQGNEDTNKSLICHKCNKIFANKLNLSRHARCYHIPIEAVKDSKYFKSFYKNCSICSKIFVDNRSFMDHMNGHENKRPFSCSHCQKTFTLKKNLTRHLRTHAVGNDKENFQKHCYICSKGFVDPSSLKRHEKKVHNIIANCG